MRKLDLIIFVSIYSIAFVIVLWYGLNHPLVNDGVKEWNAYVANINEGWKYRLTLVNSCLVTTWIPALIYKWFGGNQVFIFRLIPALFYPLMPAFAYLIAKRYVKTSYAVVSVLLILSSSFFIYFPDIGRVGVALGFMAGMLWALLSRKPAWAIAFAVLLVFSHYGTAIISLIALMMSVAGYLVWKRKWLKQYVVVFAILLILIGVWHFAIASYSGEVMWQSLAQQPYNDYDSKPYSSGKTIPQNTPDFFDLKTRESAVQQALGLNFAELPIPAKIEVIANWLVVGMITIGLYFTLKRKDIDARFKVMATSFFALIILTIVIPWLSIYYTAMRVYFTASILLAICFPIGAERIATKLRLPIMGLMVAVLVVYALSTSGIIYRSFGLVKTFPVVEQLIP